MTTNNVFGSVLVTQLACKSAAGVRLQLEVGQLREQGTERHGEDETVTLHWRAHRGDGGAIEYCVQLKLTAVLKEAERLRAGESGLHEPARLLSSKTLHA